MAGEYLLIRKDSLECPICLQSSVDSFCTFPCGHSVCHSCTLMLFSQRGLCYKCPICRYRVFSNSMPPRNFFVQNLLDSAAPFTTVASSHKKELSKEAVTEIETKHLIGRIKEQRERIEKLEIATSEKSASQEPSLWEAIIVLAALFVISSALTLTVCNAISAHRARMTFDSDVAEAKQLIANFRRIAGGKSFVTAADLRCYLPPDAAENFIEKMPPYTGPGRLPDSFDYVDYSIYLWIVRLHRG